MEETFRNTVAIFPNQVDAEDAIYELGAMGYSPGDISIVARGKEGDFLEREDGQNMASGAASGAVTGGVIGALAGLLVTTGVAPGLGVLLFGGPLASALGLTGAAATVASGATTGAIAGGLVGTLVNFGLPQREAKRYGESLREGEVLLIVPARLDEEDEVRHILAEYGGREIQSVEMEKVSEGRLMEEEDTPHYGYAHYHQIKSRGKKRKTERR